MRTKENLIPQVYRQCVHPIRRQKKHNILIRMFIEARAHTFGYVFHVQVVKLVEVQVIKTF